MAYKVTSKVAITSEVRTSLPPATRKFGMKKRNPLTADMPGWPAVKKSTVSQASHRVK